MRSILFVLAIPLASFAGDNWNQFRGPHGNGHSDSKGLPITWSESENIRWKVSVHDKGWSSPVVWSEQVWVTTADENGKAYYAVCLDRKNGNVVHDIKLFTAENPADTKQYNSYASPTPYIEAGRIYAHFGSYGTACVDTATGKVLWKRTDLSCNHWRGPASSPVVHGKLIYLVFDGYDRQYVAALNKENGETVWQKDRDIPYGTDNGDLKKAFATPAILVREGKAQVICPSAVSTVAYDAETGDMIWRATHGGMNAAARPVFGHDLVFLTSGHNTQLLAVKQGRTGDLAGDDIVWKTGRGVPSRPSLMLVDDLLFIVSDAGIPSCVEARTGKLVWQGRLNGKCSASPVYAEGRIYMADEEGRTGVFEAGREFKVLATNKLDAGCMASPAIAGDAIFLRTKTHLYCIGK